MRINLPRKRDYAAQQKHERKRPSIVGSPNVRNRECAADIQFCTTNSCCRRYSKNDQGNATYVRVTLRPSASFRFVLA